MRCRFLPAMLMRHNPKQLAFPFVIVLLLLLPPVSVKARVFVKADAQGANNGTSWTDAYTNLDSAINKTASGEIWVAAGIYKPSVNFLYNSFPAFNITKKLALYGGFKGNETKLSQRNIENNPTILSGDVGVTGYDLDNTPIVIAITGSDINSTCIVDGFTITKAYYTNAAGSYENGAVYIYTDIYNGRNPVVRNCTIKDNFGFSGAGIYVRSARPLLSNNLIINNTAYEGAGIYLGYAGDARVIGNRIINNKCIGGYTHLSGGGIQVKAYCAPYIYGNLIDNNYSGTQGGGISVESNYSAIIENNILSNNTSRDGGGVYIDFTATDLINNLFVGNKAVNNGGALYVDYSFATRSVNNTIVGNSSDNNGGAVYLVDGNMKFTNTIIYKNPTKYGKPFTCFNGNRGDWFPKLDYCDIEDGKQGIAYTGAAPMDGIWRGGNISVYPDFIDTASFAYRLRSGSACVDAGKPDTTGLHLPLTDAAGAHRFAGGRVDMGCYEYDSSFAYKDSLFISPGTVNLEGRADSTFVLTINANNNWTIISKPDWVSIGSASGNNPATLSITAIANPSLGETRSGKIIFARAGIAPTVPVTINQSGKAYITVAPDTLYIGSQQNDTVVFTVSSNTRWSINSYSNWLLFSKIYSSNNDTIVVKAVANKTGGGRVANLSVVSSDYNVYPPITKKLVVIQETGFYTLCPNASDSISSGYYADNYQWQADTGYGFENIGDNAYYYGTNSKWLKLINIPSSFNGTKYRCLVGYAGGQSYSDVFSLKIQDTWQGAISDQWENPLNWSCGVVPDANTDVVITKGNVIVNTSTTIRSLTIAPDAKLTIATGATLTILK